VEVDNGSTNIPCSFTNAIQTFPSLWPTIQITIDQSNGTPTLTYHLTLVAEPALQILAITPDFKSGDLRLEWDSNGTAVQLQGASDAKGTYVGLTAFTTEQTFTDVGALTKHPQGYFYRLQQQ